MWEIAENLRRHDLTKDQRDEHIRRYAELLATKAQTAKPDKVADFKSVGAGRGNKGIATQIAEETGLSQRTVRRALNPAPGRTELAAQRERFSCALMCPTGADEYDAAQERAEVASVGNPVNVLDGNNKPTVGPPLQHGGWRSALVPPSVRGNAGVTKWAQLLLIVVAQKPIYDVCTGLGSDEDK